MSKRQRATVISGLVVLAFAGFYYWLTINLPPGPPFEQISTKFVPTLLAGLLTVLAVLMIAAALIERRSAGEPEKAKAPTDRAAFVSTLVIVFGSLWLWKLIGFLIVPFMTAGIMVANGNKRIRQIVAVSLVMSLLLYVVFFRLFELQLPLGVLE